MISFNKTAASDSFSADRGPRLNCREEPCWKMFRPHSHCHRDLRLDMGRQHIAGKWLTSTSTSTYRDNKNPSNRNPRTAVCTVGVGANDKDNMIQYRSAKQTRQRHKFIATAYVVVFREPPHAHTLGVCTHMYMHIQDKTRQPLHGKQGHTSRIQQLQKNACSFWRLTALSATRHSAVQPWLRVVRMSWDH